MESLVEFGSVGEKFGAHGRVLEYLGELKRVPITYIIDSYQLTIGERTSFSDHFPLFHGPSSLRGSTNSLHTMFLQKNVLLSPSIAHLKS